MNFIGTYDLTANTGMTAPDRPRTYWVGIDEAGYGPNLGPLVMSAIVAQRTADKAVPDIWTDIPGISRTNASDENTRLLVDDSKIIMSRADGLAWLDRALVAIAGTINHGVIYSNNKDYWNAAFGPDIWGGSELPRWSDPEDVPFCLGIDATNPGMLIAQNDWLIHAAQTKVVGPEQFNNLLGSPQNKAQAHSQVFLQLMEWLQTIVRPGDHVHLVSDRHGGRKFYMSLLLDGFMDSWVERLHESAELSHYHLVYKEVTYDAKFQVKADRTNGFVALASMVSKLMREKWMDQFNAWFARRIPDLRPTAGYPVDAKRFAADIESYCKDQRISKEFWWRLK